MTADLDYALVARYFAGLCPTDEARELEAWAAERAERGREIERLREVWDRAGRAPLAGRADVGFRRVAERVGLQTVVPSARSSVRLLTTIEPRRRRSWLRVVGTAAAFLIVVGGGWLARHRFAREAGDRPAFTVISTALGQRLGLRLSDGSQVTLAPGSTLRTPADFGKASRVVELEGEAVFNVTHDSTRPFAVRTSRAMATDLGTRFVVRAYRDDAVTDVVVADGSVAVRQAGTPVPRRDSVIVARGERARVTGDGRLQFSRGVALEEYLAWTEGRLLLRGITLSEAAKRLSRWYDVEIRLEPETIGGRRIQAVAADNEPAIEVLQSIAESLDLRLSRSGRVFTLTAN
jgi:transmembrane sensor